MQGACGLLSVRVPACESFIFQHEEAFAASAGAKQRPVHGTALFAKRWAR